MDATAAQIDALRDEFGLAPLAVEDASTGRQRPKIEEYGDSLFAVMPLVDIAYDGSLHVGEIDVFVESNYVPSARSRSRRKAARASAFFQETAF